MKHYKPYLLLTLEKIWCEVDVSKMLAIEAANFFRNEGRKKSFLCKTIDISLNYSVVGIQLKYSTPHSLRK